MSLLDPLFGSAEVNRIFSDEQGVQRMLDAVLDFMPSPVDIPPVPGTDDDDKPVVRRRADDEKFSALAFKLMTDPYVGQLTFVRVYSGILKSGDSVFNPIRGKKERELKVIESEAYKKTQEVMGGGDAQATGIYAAAYRVIDVAFTPVKSVLYAAYSNFFRSGQHGIAASYSYAKRLMPRMIGYSLLACAGLFLFAPLFPLVIGKEFARTVEALRWLAVLPILKSIHYFFADALSGAGYQGVRAGAQVFVALTNVGLNFWLIPAYSWRGAAWSSIACDGLLAVSLYVALRVVLRRSQPTAGEKRNEEYALAD